MMMGAQIKTVRNNNHLTQPQFAELLGISTRQLVMYESGEKRVDGRMARAISWIARHGIAEPDILAPWGLR